MSGKTILGTTLVLDGIGKHAKALYALVKTPAGKHYVPVIYCGKDSRLSKVIKCKTATRARAISNRSRDLSKRLNLLALGLGEKKDEQTL